MYLDVVRKQNHMGRRMHQNTHF